MDIWSLMIISEICEKKGSDIYIFSMDIWSLMIISEICEKKRFG
jgi:hypothetical protein